MGITKTPTRLSDSHFLWHWEIWFPLFLIYSLNQASVCNWSPFSASTISAVRCLPLPTWALIPWVRLPPPVQGHLHPAGPVPLSQVAALCGHPPVPVEASVVLFLFWCLLLPCPLPPSSFRMDIFRKRKEEKEVELSVIFGNKFSTVRIERWFCLSSCKVNFFFLILFYFWMCWVFVAVHGLSLVVAGGGFSSLW